MLTRRVFIHLIGAAIVAASPALAGTVAPYTQSAFEGAQKEGKPILIAVAASWCQTCRAQEPIIEALLANQKFKGMVAFRVDFDSQKDVVRAMGAQTQSTLIVFSGAEEVARSVGDTDPESIEALLSRAL